MKNYHLTKHQGNWQLKKEDAQRSSLNFEGLNKTQAIQKSAEFLAGSASSLKIHKTDGKFQEERTYPRSADPRTTRG